MTRRRFLAALGVAAAAVLIPVRLWCRSTTGGQPDGGTVTGRFSSRSPCLREVPRDGRNRVDLFDRPCEWTADGRLVVSPRAAAPPRAQYRVVPRRGRLRGYPIPGGRRIAHPAGMVVTFQR